MGFVDCHSAIWLGCVVAVVGFLAARGVTAEPGPADLRILRPKFKVSVYAKADSARSLVSVKHKDATILFVGTRKGWGGTVSDLFAVVDSDSDGVIDESKGDFVHSLVKDGFNTPHGIALRGSSLFVSTYEDAAPENTTAVQKSLIWRLDNVLEYAIKKKVYSRGDATMKLVTDGLPGDRWHGWRYLKFDDNGKLLVTIGINCNVCNVTVAGTDKYEHGAIYRLDVDSSPVKKELLAKGVRNSVGLEHHPDTRQLYFTDNGRDDLGDNTPDCELNRLSHEGKDDFGFPYCNTLGTGSPWRRNPGPGSTFPDPNMNKNGAVRNCLDSSKNVQPLQAMGPHVAPLGLRFYKWSNTATAAFPRSWDRTLFIVQRGSWNRDKGIGYRVMSIRVDPVTGQTRNYKTFMSGWYDPSSGVQPWGRPADIEQLPDGSMVVSDDTYGAIYRITYQAPRKHS